MKSLNVHARVLAGLCLFAFSGVLAADKNGVSPQVISLPSGPGSIQGLGESFQPQLNNGSGTFSVPIQLPAAATGFAPGFSLDYHTGQGNGIVGIGWKLSGPTMISRNVDHGLPFFVDGPNGVDDDFDRVIDNAGELDRFSGVNLEELLPFADGSLRSENESSFARYRRVGDGWTLQQRNGVLHEFGTNAAARLEHNGRMFGWLLERTSDPNGNAAEYSYISDPGSPGQKYLREVRWAQQGAFYAARLSYGSGRPDVYADFRSSFEIRTGLRLTRIDVIAQGVPPSPTAVVGDFNADGVQDSLIRRYELEYEPDALVSRLSRVTLRGADGVTSLPPISFQYTNWTPPDNVASTFTLSTGEPSEAALNSDNVELIDMNQDGLPDLLNATQTLHRIHLNKGMNDLGRLEWDTVGTLVGNAPGLNLGSPSVHLADHSADGESDLVHKVNNSLVQCFFNSGQSSWTNPCNLTNTGTWPLWPFENAGSRTLDTDHNRLHDILFTGDNGYLLWMLMPGGRYGREVPLPALSDGTQLFNFEDPGARIADVNGDRISDLAWVQSTRVVYWASCGRGNFDGPFVLCYSPGPDGECLGATLSTDEIRRAEFADINGDALSDLVVVRPAASPNGIHYFVNRGIAGFDPRRTILGLPAVVTGDATRRADMNGNGSVDFLISNSGRIAGTREQFLDFVPGVRPNLLTRVDNGMGLVTTLTYESSVDQMVRARNAGNPWETTMPFAVPVVARISESDGRGNEFVRSITYRNPHYDADKQEFRGFTVAEAREIGDDSAPTKVMTSTFDKGTLASCRKGMVLSQEVTDTSGALFERVENTINHRLIEDSPIGDVCFAFNEAVDTFIHEQTASPIQLRAEYQFDDFGNVVQENKLGIAGELGDEQFVERAFAYDFANWRLDLQSRSTVRDGNGAKVAEDLFAYDGRGNLLDHHRWLNTEDRHVLAVHNDYDAFGNVIQMTDANGHSRSVIYDAAMNAFPVSEIIHLQSHDLSMSAVYDLTLGTVVSVLDFSGSQTEYQYDGLARLIEIRRPGGARTNYEYEFGNPVSHVATRVRESLQSEDTLDTHDYFDAYGRKLGSKLEAGKGRWRFSGAVAFNDRKLTRDQWLSYFTATPDFEEPDPSKPHHAHFYDAQGRAIRAVNPDGTESRTSYEPLMQHRFDENDVAGPATPTSQRSDGLGRLVEVVERNGPDEYHTRYKWNTLGDLTETQDSQGNRKFMAYDSLRRKVSMNDPDRGVATFQYDDVGNLLGGTDARGQTTVYTYDFANRLLTENYLDQGGGPADPIDVRYVYDTPSQNVDFGDVTSGTARFTGGQMAAVFDASGEAHISFDGRGNREWTVKRIRDPQLGILSSYKTAFAYDIVDRMTDLYYPDNDHCRYTYNTSSLPERIDGGPLGQTFVTNVDYAPTGRINQISFGNGVVTSSHYDVRERLISLQTASPVAGNLMHYSYGHDRTSNVTRIDDLRPFNGPEGVPADSPRRNSQRFEYDDLYRLTTARYVPVSDTNASLGTISYSYDAIGNMLSQTSDKTKAQLGVMTYGGGRFNRLGRPPAGPPGPHALTATGAGGAYEYDANGNMTHVDGATLTWDFEDRLVRFQGEGIDARYVYDYANHRVSKLVRQGGKTDQTLYVDQHFEYRPNIAPVKHVFGGASRIAQVTGVIDPQRPRLQRIWLYEGFNLVTVAVQTLQSVEELFGSDSRVYRWNGSEYQEVAAHLLAPVASPLWVEVPAARIAAALGMYEPSADAVVLPPGQNLFAWPRLEPFVPEVHLLTSDSRIHAHDPRRPHWFVTDQFLPVSIGDSLRAFDAASALWITLPAHSQVALAAGDDRATLFYHGDHLGSSSVMTDRHGALVYEAAYFPFGELRNTYQPGVHLRPPYGFTGKEQDDESGLHYFEQRYLTGRLGRFASVDPMYVSPDALPADRLAGYLAQPQDLNLYAYSRNNPIRFIDPTGLGVLDYIYPGASKGLDVLTDYYLDNVWIAVYDDWDDLDGGRSLKVGQGAVEVAVGAVSCIPTGVGCVMAAHGVDLLITAAQNNDRTYTARAITHVTGSETAGDVGDFVAGAGVGGAGLVTKGVAKLMGKGATRLPGAGAGAGAGGEAFASTLQVADKAAVTGATGGANLVVRTAPVAGQVGFRSSVAEIARADQVLSFVRSSNNARLGMDMKEAAAHFNAAVEQALKAVP